jgi:tetratricopeptide (TPR) repeat protein
VYESLPFASRRELHRRVGEYLEEHYPDALDAYLELLSFHYSNSTDMTRAFLYATKAGEKCARMFANREAVEHYHRAQDVLTILPRGTIAEQGKVYAGLGDVYVLTGRYDEAIATCRAGLDRQRWYSRGRPSEKAQAHARCAGLLCHTMGVAHERKGRYRRAMQWYRRGLATLGEQQPSLQATIHLAMAGVLHREGRYAEALEECTRGVDLARSSGNQPELAHGYYLLGNIDTDTAQVEEAIKHRQQSLDIYRRIGDLTGQAKALNNLGVDYYYMGDWQASARSYQESLALCERAGDVTEAAVVANNLGEILSDQGHLDDACQLFSKSLGTWQAIGYKIGVALACSNLGRAATRKGHHTEAIELLQRSITVFREIGSKAFLAEAHARLAEVCLELGECREAASHARGSLALAQRANAPLTEAISRRVLGEVQLRRRRWAAAERFLLESRGVDERVGACYELGQTLYDLAVLYRQAPPSLLPGGQAKEREALTLARSIFRRLGARRDLQKATQLARSAKLDRAIRSVRTEKSTDNGHAPGS